KKSRRAVILAHNYQLGEVQDIADFVGDSLELSQNADRTDAEVIVFCGVHFMAETASILCPDKIVLLPDIHAGCPMADMVTAEGLRQRKKELPGVTVVCYINSSAEVKAESDICCTSANAKKIIESVDSDTIIYLPDRNMGENLARITGKKIITWEGYCRTHHAVSPRKFEQELKDNEIISFSHLECRPEIVKSSTKTGGTGDMHRFLNEAPSSKKILFLTEQGFIDRMKVEYPHLNLVDSNMICPNMKENNLVAILEALENPKEENYITLDENIRKRAYKAVTRMLKY
ncbi:MAG: quinolinate synthase NadA, partial [Candidatus Heimdallarchaeota archaeon]|nr:quinolinate synthase NadA [Candidatus Heimdallarchaeota archaeon]MCK4876988.1 quinolinate synthase NadA [Candidatus Heimdallarchaeota archaeon]